MGAFAPGAGFFGSYSLLMSSGIGPAIIIGVPFEDRRIVVPFEARTIAIAAEDRRILVAEEGQDL